MLIDVLVGTMGVLGMAGGVSALVFYRKNGKNGHAPEPAQARENPVYRFEPVVEKLGELPAKIEQGLAPAFEGLVSCISHQVDRMVEVRMEPQVPPGWAERMSDDLEQINDRLGEPAVVPEELTASLGRVTDRLEALLQIPVPPQPDFEALVERLEALVAALPEWDQRPELVAELARGLAQLPERLAQQMSEMLAAERNRIAKSAPPEVRGTRLVASGAETGSSASGGGPPRPPRRAPPNLPRMTPGALPAMPSIPAPYVSGSVFVPAGEVWSLLVLIQQQLSPNCPGSGQEFLIAADPNNTGPILVGGASTIGGPLTADNYAYELTATSPARIYRSAYPGSSTPVGELQVLAPAEGYLHVEVQS